MAPGHWPPPPARANGTGGGVILMLILLTLLVLGGGGAGGYYVYHLKQQVAQRERLEELAGHVGSTDFFHVAGRYYSDSKPEVSVDLDGKYPCPRRGPDCADDIGIDLLSWINDVDIEPDTKAIGAAVAASGTLTHTVDDHTVTVRFGCERFDANTAAPRCHISVTITLLDR
jgi:hypothetical protein